MRDPVSVAPLAAMEGRLARILHEYSCNIRPEGFDAP